MVLQVLPKGAKMSSLDLSAFAMIDDLLQTAQANDFTNRRTNPRFRSFSQ